MPRWGPSPEWEGEDAYVVGGGPSLHDFDWDLIRGKNVIGCNSAYLLGVDIVKICIFADIEWWDSIGERGTEKFGGRVVVAAPDQEQLPLLACPWLLVVDRLEHGLGVDALGFNGNTGSLALNLALILGARRVFLLGFDMKLSLEGRPNWHDLRHEKGTAEVYPRFAAGIEAAATDLPLLFPNREVWNVTDDSELKAFPRVSPGVHFGRPVRKAKVSS